jgi:hypothetical protein
MLYWTSVGEGELFVRREMDLPSLFYLHHRSRGLAEVSAGPLRIEIVRHCLARYPPFCNLSVNNVTKCLSHERRGKEDIFPKD